MEKPILKFIQNCKGLRIVKTILRKSGRTHTSQTYNFKTYYKATVIKYSVVVLI